MGGVSAPPFAMRDRKEIAQDGKLKVDLVLEVMLDIRDLLKKQPEKKPRGRPKKTQ